MKKQSVRYKTSKSNGYLVIEVKSTEEALAYFEQLIKQGEEILNVLGLPIEERV